MQRDSIISYVSQGVGRRREEVSYRGVSSEGGWGSCPSLQTVAFPIADNCVETSCMKKTIKRIRCPPKVRLWSTPWSHSSTKLALPSCLRDIQASQPKITGSCMILYHSHVICHAILRHILTVLLLFYTTFFLNFMLCYAN